MLPCLQDRVRHRLLPRLDIPRRFRECGPDRNSWKRTLREPLARRNHARKGCQSTNRRPTTRCKVWSGRRDLNSGPPAPKAGALPGCATPRQYCFIHSKALSNLAPNPGRHFWPYCARTVPNTFTGSFLCQNPAAFRWPGGLSSPTSWLCLLPSSPSRWRCITPKNRVCICAGNIRSSLVLFLVLAVLRFVTGWSLLKLRPWGRTFALVMECGS